MRFLFLFFCLVFCSVGSVYSSEPQDVQDVLQEDIKDLVFVEKSRVVSVPSEPVDFSGFGWLEGFFDFLAVSVEFLLWGGLLLLVVLVVFKYRVWFGQLSGLVKSGSSDSVVQPVEVSIIEGESLADDVVDVVSKFWSDGHFREALGLLYRATLFRCVQRFGVPLFDHHTELDCLRIIEPCVVRDVFVFVSELSLCWQRLAYAGVVVEGDVFFGLLKRWAVLFDGEADGG